MKKNSDVLIVGGSLSGCLLALKLASSRSDVEVHLVEEGSRLAGSRTWTFFESDVSRDSLRWLEPVLGKTWPEYHVQFPKLPHRKLTDPVYTLRSEDLHRHLTSLLGPKIKLRCQLASISDLDLTLKNGRKLNAPLVIDAREASSLEENPMAGYPYSGYKKSLGFEFDFENSHGLESPIMVDARCPQLDGYRYFTLLPWSDTRLSIYETFYSHSPNLHRERVSKSIFSYAERRGWKLKPNLAISEIREESMITPIPMTSQYISVSVSGEALPIGTKGGYFHAMTGDEFPDSIRFVEFIGDQTDLSTQKVRDALMKYRRSWISRQRFYRSLNRLMFQNLEPSLRFQIFQSLFENSSDAIERFHSGKTSWGDRLRILTGSSPTSFSQTLKSLSEKSIGEIKP